MKNICGCPHREKVDRPTLEFTVFTNGNEITKTYRYGYTDIKNGECPICCQFCDKWVYGRKCEDDFHDYIRKVRKSYEQS